MTLVAMLGCGEPPPTVRVLAFGDDVSAPALAETAPHCDDLGRSHRVCFGSEVVVSTRPPVPHGIHVPHDGQVRCEGTGLARTCRLLRRRTFLCSSGGTDELCEQAMPRVPDDGEWECADVDGLVVCRGRSAAAGVVAGPPEPGWICGDTRPRICVDLAPDLPAKLGDEVACRFHHSPQMRRVCRPGSAPRLAGRCSSDDECPSAMICSAGSCAPRERPRPDCWTQVDCEEGRACVLATCT